MQFISTRGHAPRLGFADTMLTGLANDGGLYLPESWPQISPEQIASFANAPFASVAYEVIRQYTGEDFDDGDLRQMVDQAYAPFHHPSTTPLVEIEPGHYLLELFHGPTLAFKDVAMQFLARAMDHVLGGSGQSITIIGATSGDTGSAAIEAFRGRNNVDIFILHPHNRTSDVQRRQMTSVDDANVHNIALKGSFDDCQRIVKGLFSNTDFRQKAKLSGVNSINWGRIVAQISYYFRAAAELGAPARRISFCVPTGNFGDIFAGYAAKRMGLPIEKLIIATNDNDILARTMETGRYQTSEVVATDSPSMDIQISSNFERLLFEASGRDAAVVRRLMGNLEQSGGFELSDSILSAIREDFSAVRSTSEEASVAMREALERSHYLADPHTAVGISVSERFLGREHCVVTLATAHPAKFPEAVLRSTGVEPALPVWLADLHTRLERFDVLENDQRLVEDYVRTRSRAWEG